MRKELRDHIIAALMSEFNKGDMVKVLRTPTKEEASHIYNDEDYWYYDNDYDTSEYVGEIGKVVAIDGCTGSIIIQFNDDNDKKYCIELNYPHFVLEKVEAPTSPDSEKS